MNQEAKDLLLSKTTWGALLQALAALMLLSGVDIGPTEVWVEALVAIAGLGLALWGRIDATQPIGSVGGIKVGRPV